MISMFGMFGMSGSAARGSRETPTLLPNMRALVDRAGVYRPGDPPAARRPGRRLLQITLDGYRTTRLLRASGTTHVFEAIREHDQRTVVAKIYDIEANEGLEARVQHEFRLIHGLEVEGVVRALALERAGNQLALVLDWCEGVNLEEYCAGQPLAIDEFLAIALQITRALTDVHAQRVIHRDLKPTNLLINPVTKRVAIADFGISVLLESERERINDPAVVEGTLPYISPEQTGRTGREVDFRSDLYSLGVTFYELLTGRRPFEADTPLELIHAHLARRPESPHWLRPELPRPLSAMVMKLLEKAPERRYQSASGLHQDLLALHVALDQGQPFDAFELARHDVPSTLQLPHRLYGRGRESELLIREFRKAAQGSTRLVVISGPSGIGKTALLEQLVEPVLGRRGYFARGRFERDGVEQPFAGIVGAFEELADQLLTESDERLARWQALLHEQLGGLTRVLTRLVPKFEAILGPEPATAELNVAEVRQRVLLACVRLLAAVARPEHPLVLAIDDLQWADPGSCELLEAVLAERELALLVVGTLGATAPELPVVDLFARLHQAEFESQRVELGPLARADVAALVADATARTDERIDSLVDLLVRRADGSPMLIRQLLVHLADLGLMWPSAEGWSWDPAAIETAGIPEDSLEMMAAKLDRLSERPRELLTMAAVLGERFDVQLLEELAGPERVAEGLYVLVENGLLAATSPRQYAFSHSRIREAAYLELDHIQLRELHLAVGELRLSHLGVGDLGDHIFDLVDHLDRGHGLLPLGPTPGSQPDRRAAVAQANVGPLAYELAELNGLAGYKALDTAAAHLAVQYLEVGVALREQVMPFPNHGEVGYSLALSLELGLAQALVLSGEPGRGDAGFATLLTQRLADGDRGRVIVKRYEMLAIAGRYDAAVEFGLSSLRELGMVVPRSPSKLEVGVALVRMAAALRRSDLSSLHDRPWAKQPRARVIMELLAALSATVYTHDGGLFVLLVEHQLTIFLAEGRHPVAPLVLVQAGLLLGSKLELRELGAAVVELGEAMAEREGQTCPRQRVAVIAAFARVRLDPHSEVIPRVRRATALALESGDLEFAGYSLTLQVSLELLAGAHLRVIDQQIEAGQRWMQRWRGQEPAGGLTVIRRFCARLAHDAPAERESDPLGCAELLRTSSEASRQNGQLFTALILFVFDRRREALELLDASAEDLERVLVGSWHLAVCVTLRGLALASEYPRLRGRERWSALERLRQDERRLRRWAEQAPANFEHRANLLAAELAAIEGDLRKALELLGRARRQAAAQRCIVFEVLALERSAELCRDHGLDDLATGPLQEARDRWHHWGAFAKVAALERRWPTLRDRFRGVRELGDPSGSTSTSTSSRALDTATLLKTSQAIAEDLRLEEVVDRVLASALENAGAERGALILPIRRGLGLAALVSAEGTSHDFGGSSDPRQNFLHQPLPLDQAGSSVPVSLIHWVERTREAVVIDDASADLRFTTDSYVRAGRVRSVLCLPIVKLSRLVGLLYLENRLSKGSFTGERLEILRVLTAQAASAIENAQLYEALRTSEVRWRSLVEGLPDIVALLDRAGRVEFINHLDEDVVRSRAIGFLADDFIATEHRSQAHAAMAQVLQRRELVEFEMCAALPDGEMRWYSARLAPIVVDGRVERIIAVATDITGRRQAEQDKRQLETQLRQQQRLESLGTLASGVAHEINNPVQGIMNYAELIAATPGASVEIREYAGEIDRESQRVATIVRNLLAFSRQEGERGARAVTVKNVIEGSLSLIRTVLRKDQIGLDIAVGDDLPEVVCRPQQIQQVLMNLVTNARDALNARFNGFDERKRITIDARSFVREDATWIRLRVCDQGGGVPDEVVPHIFDPFFTTKGRDQGTGLGLAVSHGIVTEHGGRLRLDNQPGTGACFEVELPIDGSGVEVRRREAPVDDHGEES
jgi:PAS domain S-box-containing protein